MKKQIYLLSLVFLVLFQFSCKDESTFNNPVHNELENGAFVRFTNNPPAPTYADAQNIVISEEIYDANNNAIDYTLTLKATIGGSVYINDDFINKTSFPTVLEITSQSISDAIGVPVSEFNFGDSFEFVAKVTRNDGVVFYGVEPTFDEDELTIGIGNTEGNLLGEPAYKNAMNFSTIVSCPFVQADMLGTYTIIEDDGFSATGNTQFEIIAGATENQIILVNPYDSAGAFNIVIDVDDFGIASFPRQDGVLTEEICCTGYTPTHFTSNAITSLSLSCIGYLELHFSTGLGFAGSDGTGFTFGDGVLIAQKN